MRNKTRKSTIRAITLILDTVVMSHKSSVKKQDSSMFAHACVCTCLCVCVCVNNGGRPAYLPEPSYFFSCLSTLFLTIWWNLSHGTDHRDQSPMLPITSCNTGKTHPNTCLNKAYWNWTLMVLLDFFHGAWLVRWMVELVMSPVEFGKYKAY